LTLECSFHVSSYESTSISAPDQMCTHVCTRYE